MNTIESIPGALTQCNARKRNSCTEQLISKVTIALAAALAPTALSGCPKPYEQTKAQTVEKKESAIKLFDGELEIRPDGIYTFAHTYIHPRTNVTVTLVGSNHGGDASYFQTINTLLMTKDAVIYEGLPKAENTQQEQNEPSPPDLEKLVKENIDAAYQAAVQQFFIRGSKKLNLANEEDYFDTHRKDWQSADAVFFDRMQKDWEFQKNYAENTQKAVPPSDDRKHEIVRYVQGELRRMDEEIFTRRDFAQGFSFFFSDAVLREYIIRLYGHPRDDVVFELFDRINGKEGIRTIGIRYGAGHMSNQRRLLEERGFLLHGSMPLRNIAFAQ